MEDITNNALYYILVYNNKDATYAYFIIGYILEHVLHLDLYGYHMERAKLLYFIILKEQMLLKTRD